MKPVANHISESMQHGGSWPVSTWSRPQHCCLVQGMP